MRQFAVVAEAQKCYNGGLGGGGMLCRNSPKDYVLEQLS